MTSILSFSQFLNESEKQTKAGKDFEDLIGGVLKNSDIIKDVVFKDKELDVIPNGKLGKIDVSLIMGLLQDNSNVDKLKNVFKGIKSIKFDKMTIEVK
jgi:hypothetical protein